MPLAEIHAFVWFNTNHFYPFLPLDYPQQKRKSPVKSLATIGGALHSWSGFLFAVSSRKRKKITRPRCKNGCFLISPVKAPYLLLSLCLSFWQYSKAYICLEIDTHRPDTPKGKREKPSLRELEQQIRRDIEDGIDSTGKKMTLCQLYAKQNAQRENVKKSTQKQREQLMRFIKRGQVRC